MENVDQDRRHAIDAAIVRTMKSRKVLQHQQVPAPALHLLRRSAEAELYAPARRAVLKPSCMRMLTHGD